MSAVFEPVMAALLTHLQAVPGFTGGWSRRLAHWEDVSTQPAGFLRRVGTDYEYQGQMQVAVLECEVWIYSKAGEDPSVDPDAVLSTLDQAVRDSFTPDADSLRFTLGGLAYWCRVEGRADYSPGDQAGQGIARIPLRVKLPWA